MEKREPLGTVGGNVNWGSYGKQYGGSSKKNKKNSTTILPGNSTSVYLLKQR